MMQQKNEVISYHTFMLPFTFEGEFEGKEDWIYKPFEMKTQRDYNEYVYFYKHVQDALFNTKEETSKAISNYYEYKNQEGTYTIDSKIGLYELEVDGISLRVFNTKIAILSLNLKNTIYDKKQDILAINEFGRRIYPQFLGENGINDTKEAFLAKSITLTFKNEEPISEYFHSFYSLHNIEKKFIPKFIKRLLENSFQTEILRPIIDDRMFVISQYNSDKVIEKLKKYNSKNGYVYENNEFWYKYIFIDGDKKNCQSRYMTQELIRQSTYDRWIEAGTLFGVSRYSFVSLSGNWFGENILLPHMQTIYFEIFTLLLAYRASIIKFSDEIQNITGSENEKLSKDAQTLYRNYLEFLNKLYFKEVTAQDQGIELYNKAMEVMDIPKYMSDLDKEINELHSFVSMLEEKKTAELMNKLTWIGGILLPPSLVTGFLGMNSLDGLDKIVWFEKSEYGLWSLTAVIVSALIIPFYLKFFEKERDE